MKKCLILCVFGLLSLSTWGQTYSAGGMEVGVSWVCDSIEMDLSAPTTGWLAVGIHRESPLPGADLKMVRVRQGIGEGSDRFVQAPGHYPPDTELGGTASLRIVEAREANGHTWLKIRFPIHPQDPFDQAFTQDNARWITLAYSVSDDYLHHSRMRQQLPLAW